MIQARPKPPMTCETTIKNNKALVPPTTTDEPKAPQNAAMACTAGLPRSITIPEMFLELPGVASAGLFLDHKGAMEAAEFPARQLAQSLTEALDGSA